MEKEILKLNFLEKSNFSIKTKKAIDIIKDLKMSILEWYIIEYVLWMREVIKLEEDEWEKLTDYTDEKIDNILYKYWLIWKLIYWRILLWDDKFIIFAKNKKIMNEFLFYDFSSDANLRAFETWKRLWYPECCIKKYISFFSINPDNSNIDYIIDLYNDEFLKNDTVKNILKNYPFLNERYMLLSHHFCSPICKESIKKAKKKLIFILNNIDFIKNN